MGFRPVYQLLCQVLQTIYLYAGHGLHGIGQGGPLLPTAKALLQFQTEPNEEVLVKVGVSAVDMDGARKNVEAEISGWDFDGVRRAARQQWNTYLSKIDIDTKDNEPRVPLFLHGTLPHGYASPNLFYRC